MYRYIIKPLLDRTGALILLIFTLPLFLVIAFLVWLTMGWPILFRQERAGLHGKIFCIYKFRTMTNERDAEGHLLPDEQRLTNIGAFIRATSLDELPQLWNVLKGEMSFIGPRPLLPEYLPLYSPEQARRHEVLPGITGWAQVNGRNALSWEEKFRLDVEYVDKQSFLFDLKIILLTLSKVFKREGINKEGHATTEKFNGHN
ncbi:MAG: sugar transferase [Campylobacterales bacterium]